MHSCDKSRKKKIQRLRGYYSRDWREDMKKRISLASVLFYGAAAVLWTIRIVLDIAYRTFEESTLFFVVDLLGFVVLSAAFFSNLHRYRLNDEEK